MSVKQFFVAIITMGLGIFIIYISALFIMEASSGEIKNVWYFTFLLSLPHWAVFTVLGIGFLLLFFGMGLFFRKIKL